MKPIKFFQLFLLLISPFYLRAVDITEGQYEGRAHFIIATKLATYYFDKEGGGFSRMIDKNGNDWIAFKKEPWDKAPESAASSYRGIPNAVFKEADGGCGHPGFNQATSTQESTNSILTKSNSGKWEWRWTFYDNYACWEILKTDETRNYWFLYEGPVGGAYKPGISYWGNDKDGRLTSTPNHLAGEHISANWQWAYFGRTDQNTTLFVAQQNVDTTEDFFSYMGSSAGGIQAADGMLVFGFGRAVGSKQLLTGKNKYYIGFWDANISNAKKNKKLKHFIERKIIKKEHRN